jgi:hypothetical protein
MATFTMETFTMETFTMETFAMETCTSMSNPAKVRSTDAFTAKTAKPSGAATKPGVQFCCSALGR